MATSKKTTTSTHADFDDAYFRGRHNTQPYYLTGMDYDADYAPAYQYGMQLVRENDGKDYGALAKAAQSGWTAARGQSRLDFAQAEPAIRDAFDRVIQLREEQLNVHKDTVEAGAVNLKKSVTTTHKEVTVPVDREEVVIERKAVNKTATGTIGDSTDENIRVPVSEERVRVSKDAVVTEEVSVGKKKVTDQKTVGADLKKEELVVEKDGDANVRTTDSTKKKM